MWWLASSGYKLKKSKQLQPFSFLQKKAYLPLNQPFQSLSVTAVHGCGFISEKKLLLMWPETVVDLGSFNCFSSKIRNAQK